MTLVQTLRRQVNLVVDTGLSFLPARTVGHLATASTEVLLAARAVIDEQIVWNGRHAERADAIRRARRAARAGEGAEAALPDAGAPTRPD